MPSSCRSNFIRSINLAMECNVKLDLGIWDQGSKFWDPDQGRGWIKKFSERTSVSGDSSWGRDSGLDCKSQIITNHLFERCAIKLNLNSLCQCFVLFSVYSELAVKCRRESSIYFGIGPAKAISDRSRIL